MKKITILFAAIFIASHVFSQESVNLELKIIPQNKKIELYNELWLNTYLINHSEKPIKMFNVGHCEYNWRAYEDIWQGTLNETPMVFDFFRDGAASSFTVNSIVDVMPGDSIYAGLLRYKIIAGGDYSIKFTFSQAPENVRLKYADSPAAVAKAKEISTFSVTSKPFKFTIADSKLGAVEIHEISDEELAHAPTIYNIEQAFSKPSEAYKLNVSGNITNEVMQKICKLKNLKELYLSEITGITEIPAEINQLKLRKLGIFKTDVAYPDDMKNMTSLKELKFNQLNIDKLPEFVKNLNNLETLHVTYCPITELPDELRNFNKLSDINLSITKLTSLGTILSNLDSLKFLYIISPLNSFPDISGCKNLKELTLNSSREIITIPSFIGNFSELEVLNLASTGVTSIPPEIARLKKLKSIVLSKTNLTTIPAELYECSLLENINFADCQLKTCAGGIDKLTNLKEIYLHRNQLSELPVGLSKCMNLTYVNVHTNNIKGSDKEGKILANRMGKKYRVKE